MSNTRPAIDILEGMFPDKILEKLKGVIPLEQIANFGIRVAKLHVEAALDAAAEMTISTTYHKDLIRNSYPLENIK